MSLVDVSEKGGSEAELQLLELVPTLAAAAWQHAQQHRDQDQDELDPDLGRAKQVEAARAALLSLERRTVAFDDLVVVRAVKQAIREEMATAGLGDRARALCAAAVLQRLRPLTVSPSSPLSSSAAAAAAAAVDPRGSLPASLQALVEARLAALPESFSKSADSDNDVLSRLSQQATTKSFTYHNSGSGSGNAGGPSSGFAFASFNFDDLDDYQPLEATLAKLRFLARAPLSLDIVTEGLNELLSMDAGELAEHPQWTELLQLLQTLLAEATRSGGSLGYHGGDVAIRVVQVYLKYFLAFRDGSQSIDAAQLYVDFLLQSWATPDTADSQRSVLVCASSDCHDVDVLRQVLSFDFFRIQFAALHAVITVVMGSSQLSQISAKQTDQLLLSVFRLLARGFIEVDISDSASSSLSFDANAVLRLSVLDVLFVHADGVTSVADAVESLSRRVPAVAVLQHALAAGLLSALHARTTVLCHRLQALMALIAAENAGAKQALNHRPREQLPWLVRRCLGSARLLLQLYGGLLPPTGEELLWHRVEGYLHEDMCVNGIQVSPLTAMLTSAGSNPLASEPLTIVADSNKRFATPASSSCLLTPLLRLTESSSSMTIAEEIKARAPTSAMVDLVEFLTVDVPRALVLSHTSLDEHSSRSWLRSLSLLLQRLRGETELSAHHESCRLLLQIQQTVQMDLLMDLQLQPVVLESLQVLLEHGTSVMDPAMTALLCEVTNLGVRDDGKLSLYVKQQCITLTAPNSQCQRHLQLLWRCWTAALELEDRYQQHKQAWIQIAQKLVGLSLDLYDAVSSSMARLAPVVDGSDSDIDDGKARVSLNLDVEGIDACRALALQGLTFVWRSVVAGLSISSRAEEVLRAGLEISASTLCVRLRGVEHQSDRNELLSWNASESLLSLALQATVVVIADDTLTLTACSRQLLSVSPRPWTLTAVLDQLQRSPDGWDEVANCSSPSSHALRELLGALCRRGWQKTWLQLWCQAWPTLTDIMARQRIQDWRDCLRVSDELHRLLHGELLLQLLLEHAALVTAHDGPQPSG